MHTDAQVYTTLEAALSAADRPAVIRRLRRTPQLWEALLREEFLAKAVSFAGGDPERWRPGLLGLLLASETDYLRARFAKHGATAPKAAAASLERANAALQAAITDPDPALDRAALAALALSQKTAFAKTAEPVSDPASPLVWACQYAIAPDPKEVIDRLSTTLPGSAQTMLQTLLANENADRAAEILTNAAAGFPPSAAAALAEAAARMGEDEIARRIAGSARKEVASEWSVGQRTDRVRLARIAGEAESAATEAEAARQEAKAALLDALRESAQIAEDARNYNAALSYRLEANAFAPGAAGIRSGIARALAGLGRNEEALGSLGNAEGSEDLLLAAELQRKLGKTEKALEAARNAFAHFAPDTDPRLLPAIADCLVACGDASGAKHVIARAAKSAPADTALQARLARLAADSHDWKVCEEAAAAAWHIDPEDAGSLGLLARAALECGRPADAASYYRTLAAKVPDDATACTSLARACLAAGQPEPASQAAARALALDPDCAAAHSVLGQIAYARGESEAAFASLQKAVRLDPTDTAPWKALAELHAAKGNREAALTTLRAGAESAADPAELLLALGRLLADGGLLRDAAASLERALGMRPGDADILVALAETYLGLDRAADAEDCLRRALAARPALKSAVRMLVGLLEKTGRLAEAREVLERAAAADSESPDLFTQLGSILLSIYRAAPGADDKTLPAALSALETAGKFPSGQTDTRRNLLLGWAHTYAGELPAAVESFRALLQQGEALALEARVDAHEGLAEALLRSGDCATAVSNLQAALQLAPGKPVLRHSLGRALLAAGLHEDSREVYRLILADEPADADALAGLAESEYALGNPAEAAAAIQKAVEQDAHNPQLWIRLAEIQTKSGETGAARATVSRALENETGLDIDTILRAARLLAALGDAAEAERTLDAAIAAHPHCLPLLTGAGDVLAAANRNAKCFDCFRHAAELAPFDPSPLHRAGEALWRDGRKAAALSFYRKAADLNPEDTDLARTIATGLAATGQTREALSFFEKIIARAEIEPAVALEAARAAFQSGDLEKAGKWITSTADSPEGMVLRARIALAQENAGEAADICSDLTTLEPGDARGWALLAESLVQREPARGKRKDGDDPYAAARAALRKAFDLASDSPEALLLTGNAGLALEEYGSAVHCFELLCGVSPDDPQAHAVLAGAAIVRAEALYRRQLAGGAEEWTRSVSAAVADAVRTALARAAALGESEEALQPLFARAALAFAQPEPESIAVLESLYEEHPAAETALAIAQAWLRAGDGEKARKAAQSAIALEPGLPAARTLLAICEWKAGRRETAIATLAEAAESAPWSPLPHALAAQILHELDRRGDAQREMQKAVQAAPDSAAWQHTLGAWLEAAGDTAAALPHLQRAADLDPHSGAYRLSLARALHRDGDALGAAAHYQAAVSLLPTGDGTIQSELGRAAIEAGRPAVAYEAFTSAQILAGAAAPAAWTLGKARAALALGRGGEARTLVQAVFGAKDCPPEARMVLAEVEESEGRLHEAIRHLDHAAAEMSDPVPAALRLARLWTATGSAARAILSMQALTEAAPSNDEAWHRLAEALAAQNRFEEALTASQQAVHLAPRSAEHWMLQGRIARKLGQLDQSLAALTKAREAAPADWRTGLECGLTYEAEARWDLALAAYRDALALAPENAELHYRLGVVHKNLRAYPEAMTSLRKSLQIDPQNLSAHRLLSGVMALNLVYGAGVPGAGTLTGAGTLPGAGAQPLETR